jgi:glycosyltransferase involved in cell wall biosynthesis
MDIVAKVQMTLRVAVLAPTPLESPRGNAVTVARVVRALRARGLEVSVWEAAGGPEPLAEARRMAPALVHAFHAYRAGPPGRALAEACRAPLVVTLTGTDVSEHLAGPSTATVVRGVLRGAAAVTAFHESVAAAVRAAVPETAGRLAVVPQSVSFEPPPPTPEPPGPALSGRPCILFPAGIRSIKRPRMPLGPLDRVVRRRPDTRLWYVGPALDTEEVRRLEQALAPRGWARYVGAVPHHRMPALLGAADIVLNCSASEGGMANAVLEALAEGRAVLAADIPGNRSVIEDGVTGLLFGSEVELADKTERLAADAELRQRLGEAGRRLVSARFTPEVETAGYLAVYARVVGRRDPL